MQCEPWENGPLNFVLWGKERFDSLERCGFSSWQLRDFKTANIWNISEQPEWSLSQEGCTFYLEKRVSFLKEDLSILIAGCKEKINNGFSQKQTKKELKCSKAGYPGGRFRFTSIECVQ